MSREQEVKLWLPKELMESMEPAWFKYWKGVAPRFDVFLQTNANPLVERYLINSFAIFSFVTEDFDKKTTKKSELRPNLSVFLVETHDLMRGVIANHAHMTLAPLALVLRTVFEIHVHFRFIVNSSDPAKWADLYDRYQEVEQLLGSKSSPSIPDPTEADFTRVAARNPEWFKPGTNTPMERMNWTADERMNLRQMSKSSHVNLEEEYKSLYKTNSKFTHASPLIRNMYRKDGGLRSVPDRRQSDQLSMLAMSNCMKILEEACEFFGVEFPKFDYCVVCNDMLEAIGQRRLNPSDFRDK
jgi:hypothetical protein